MLSVDRSREGSNKARAERSRSPRKPRDEPQEDPDERYERLRLERQLRDKEQAYQEVSVIAGGDVCVLLGCIYCNC